jgi:hypothetical protein
MNASDEDYPHAFCCMGVTPSLNSFCKEGNMMEVTYYEFCEDGSVRSQHLCYVNAVPEAGPQRQKCMIRSQLSQFKGLRKRLNHTQNKNSVRGLVVVPIKIHQLPQNTKIRAAKKILLSTKIG